MEKVGIKARDIRFYSQKNSANVCVHSQQARDYSKFLEAQPWVVRYEACVPLDLERYKYVNPVDIRAEHFKIAWASDFLIYYADGRKGVRELSSPAGLRKRATVEKLEFSRRYWAGLDIDDWKIVIAEKPTEEGA